MSDINSPSGQAIPVFRPSEYSTGLEPLQPYTRKWPQGSEYGEWWTSLTQYTPAGYVARKVGEWTSGGEQEGSVGGTCTDHSGLLGKVGAKVSCAALLDAQQGNAPGTTPEYETPPDLLDFLNDDPPPDEDPDWKAAAVAISTTVLLGAGVAALVRYQKHGRVF